MTATLLHPPPAGPPAAPAGVGRDRAAVRLSVAVAVPLLAGSLALVGRGSVRARGAPAAWHASLA